ncbi:MAG: transcription termination factor NusA [Planctomycetes bacterium]|nr:transcription termination factor NusA [Planctomycetota bacterium]
MSSPRPRGSGRFYGPAPDAVQAVARGAPAPSALTGGVLRECDTRPNAPADRNDGRWVLGPLACVSGPAGGAGAGPAGARQVLFLVEITIMNSELLRIIETIHLDKDIPKDLIFETIEQAMVAAIQKAVEPKLGKDVPIRCTLDRSTGQLSVTSDVDTGAIDLGRIAAQTAKQVIIQSLREAENQAVCAEYADKIGQLVLGTVQRIEGGTLVVNIGKAEAIIPRADRVKGEMYSPGDRIRGIITEVKQVAGRVRILLSRVTPDLVRNLFELEVPEVADGVIEIRRIAREPGYRTKIAVFSNDQRVDCVGACVGIRGTRIKAITDELNGEKIDIIRWSESDEDLITNALRPAQLASLQLDRERKIVRVVVPDDQLALAIGRKGQNVRLATRLTGWDIKIEGVTQMPHSARDEHGNLIAPPPPSSGGGGSATSDEPAGDHMSSKAE